MIRFAFLALLLVLAPGVWPATLIENGTVFTLADGVDAPFEGYVLVEDGLIKAIGRGKYTGPKPQDVVDAKGKFVIPGFVSGHNHLWQSAFRGIAADGELYAWLSALHWTYGDYFGEGDFYTFTLHGALDQLAHGITTTYNHSQRLGATEAYYLESLDASMVAGQHFVFAYNPNLAQPLNIIRKDVEAFVDKSNKARNPLLLGLSLSSVGSYTGDMARFKLEMALAREYDMTVQIHYLEEYHRRFDERKKWPTFVEAGAVGEDVSYAHFIHTTEKILDDSARFGSAMIWNPLSNGRLASGLADIPLYLEKGIRVGMGVDGAASADIADPFENMRMGLYALRMKHMNASVMSPIEMLRLHTLKTAEVLGVADRVGSLEAGKSADLLIVDPAASPLGAVFDPAALLVFAASAQNIERIYVQGVLQVRNGEVLGHNFKGIQSDTAARVAAIRARAADH